MSTVYVGKAGLTLVRRLNGRTDYVYLGQPAPADAVEGEAERLTAEGYLTAIEVADPKPEVTGVVVEPSLDEMNADGLKAYADEHGIDIGRASTEDGIRAKIASAPEA